MRQEGYYWVKYEGEWIIAEWCAFGGYNHWYITAYLGPLDDKHFDEIDENQIVRGCKVDNSPDPEQLKIDAWYREFFAKYPHLQPNDSFEYNESIKPNCSSTEHCAYTGECQQSFITGGSCRYSSYNKHLKH